LLVNSRAYYTLPGSRGAGAKSIYRQNHACCESRCGGQDIRVLLQSPWRFICFVSNLGDLRQKQRQFARLKTYEWLCGEHAHWTGPGSAGFATEEPGAPCLAYILHDFVTGIFPSFSK
jgi:hypothetical protein